MALVSPTTYLGSLTYIDSGEPFVSIPPNSTTNMLSLSYIYHGEPFVVNYRSPINTTYTGSIETGLLTISTHSSDLYRTLPQLCGLSTAQSKTIIGSRSQLQYVGLLTSSTKLYEFSKSGTQLLGLLGSSSNSLVMHLYKLMTRIKQASLIQSLIKPYINIISKFR